MNRTSNDDLSLTVGLLSRYPVFAGTVGLDRTPQVRTVVFCQEKDGALYFLTAKSERFYAELSADPHIQLCAASEDSCLRVTGRVCFVEDPDNADPLLREHPDKTARLGAVSGPIPFFLTGASGLLTAADGFSREFSLAVGDSVLTGMTIRKKTELRDRLASLLTRREAEGADLSNDEAAFAQKLYDGALLYAAQTAKALWSRMDINPIERAAVFETYDERERFVLLARKLIGNAAVTKPEDFTYLLNRETLTERFRESK